MKNKTIYQIKGPHKNIGEECEKVLRSLPDWFGIEDAIVEYRQEIDHLDTFYVESDSELIAFFSVKKHFNKSAELYVLAVGSGFHGQGIGYKIFQAVESHLRDEGFEFLQVKTVSDGNPDPFYKKTRKTYLRWGFTPLEVFPTLWDAHNPCLLLIKSI